jgi:Domain of unknown function (DUF4331)
MSHHLDAPMASQNGQLYIDDLYVFQANESTVFVMDVNSTITEPNVKRGFHSEARYEFKVHIDGAEYEDLTYRVTFGDLEADGRQHLQLRALTADEARDESATGELMLEGWTGDTVGNGHTHTWAGRIGDPFFIDLSLLSRVNGAVADGSAVDLSEWNPEEAHNSFANTTVDSIVLAVSHQDARLRPGTDIGVWATTKLATDAGGWRQINRAGHPMMWPIFWPTDAEFTDRQNTRHPSEDFSALAKEIGDRIAAVVAAGGNSEDPQGYATAVVQRLFPDVLPYVVGTPATYGLVGFNGRTLADNAPEAMLSLVAGTAIPSGLKASISRHLRSASFPYVVPVATATSLAA